MPDTTTFNIPNRKTLCGPFGTLKVEWGADPGLQQRVRQNFLRSLLRESGRWGPSLFELLQHWLTPAFMSHVAAHPNDRAFLHEQVLPALATALYHQVGVDTPEELSAAFEEAITE